VRITRLTSDSRFRPTNGTRFDAAIEQVGALGGDFDLTKLSASYTIYVPIYESFLGPCCACRDGATHSQNPTTMPTAEFRMCPPRGSCRQEHEVSMNGRTL
jgi:hypothetical protein